MATIVRIETYDGLPLSEWHPVPPTLLSMQWIDNPRFPLLRWVDPFGQTMFSYRQMNGLIPEIETLLAETEEAHDHEFLTHMLELAKLCESRIGASMRILGD